MLASGTPWGLGLLAVVWTMAAIGIAIKLFAPRYLEGVTTATTGIPSFFASRIAISS